MGVAYNPKIVTNGLVLALDAGNIKSYDKYENLVTYSQKFDDAIWNKNNCSVIQNDIISPDNTLTAARITATVNDDVIVDNYYTATYNETPLTYSIFAKAGTYRYIAIQSYVNVWSKTLVFDLQTGNPIEPFYPNDGRTWKIVSYPNGWYRCIVTYPANYYYYYRFRFALTNYVGPSDGGIDTTNSPSVGQYIYVWGAQLEKGTTATDYYATTSSLKNRNTTNFDLSGKSNNGTLTNGPLYNNNNVGSLVFDGANDYVSLPASSSLGKSINYTTSAWVKYSDVGYTSWMIICDSVDYNVGGGYMMWLDDSAPSTGKRLASYDGSIGWQYGTVRIPPNIWAHVCISKNNNALSFYVNGLFNVTITYNFNSSTSSTAVDIGGSNRNGYPFNGNIAQVSIYNRALSAAEVQQNFNATRGRYGI
jgi:hypothetical protein